jgi:acetolactate synthase-1/2/3 large subunit
MSPCERRSPPGRRRALRGQWPPAQNSRGSGTDFRPVDYVKYAEGFGAKGLMIGRPDEVAAVLKQAFDIPGPVIVAVDVHCCDNHKLFEMVDENVIH